MSPTRTDFDIIGTPQLLCPMFVVAPDGPQEVFFSKRLSPYRGSQHASHEVGSLGRRKNPQILLNDDCGM